MNWKRNISSYPFLALMTVIGLAGLILSTVNASFAFGSNEVVGAVICVVLLTIAGSGTYFLHIFRTNHPESFECPTWMYVLTGLVLLGCIAIGITLAVLNISDAELTSPYFYAAKVQAGCRAPYFVHGATNTYVAFLNKVYFFFGNHAVMGIYAQIVLWVLVILCIGAGVWFAVSKKAAAAAIVLASLIPTLRTEAIRLSPVMLSLFFWSVVFAWICCSTRLRKREIVAGISCFLIGLLTYFDLSGILLLPLLIALETRSKTREMSGETRKSILIKIVVGMIALAAAYFMCIFMDASFSEKSAGAILEVWFSTYSGGAFPSKEIYQSVTLSEFIPVYFLICLGALAFWRNRRFDAFKGWTLEIFLILIFFLCGLFSERVTGYSFLAVLLYVLAAVGLETSLAAVEVQPAEKIDAPEEEQKAEKTKKEKKKSRKKSKDDLKDTASADETDKWIPLGEELDAVLAEEVAESTVVKQNVEKSGQSETKEPEIKFLENPLPLPKKHERKAVDFPIASNADDDYDYAVADDDDYDIQ